MPLSETDLLFHFIARVPEVLPRVRVFRRNIINALATSKGANGRTWRVRNGIAGQADAYALVAGGGHVEIETKAADGRLELAQKRWRVFCGAFDIPHLVLRAKKGESTDETITRWIDELRAVVERAA